MHYQNHSLHLNIAKKIFSLPLKYCNERAFPAATHPNTARALSCSTPFSLSLRLLIGVPFRVVGSTFEITYRPNLICLHSLFYRRRKKN
jgi:hypothetical protein